MTRSLFFLLILSTANLSAATLYVSDELNIPLRRGATNGHKISAYLTSGAALEVLGEDKASGFTQVRTQNGTEGWAPTQYLTSQPAAREQLAAANRRVQSLEAQLKSTRESYQETRGARADAEGRIGNLDKQTRQLQNELAEVRRVSSTSIAHYEENKLLKTENQELKTRVTELDSQVGQLRRNSQLRWLLGGGALVIFGLMLGAWIKSRPKRSNWA